MKRPSGAAVAHVLVLVTVLALASTSSRDAFAQGDPRYAVDHFESSERGSEWFANESLDLRGHWRPSIGYVIALSHRTIVVPSSATSPELVPVKDLAFLHIGGSVVLVDRLRLAIDLPFQVYASGETAVVGGTIIPAPPKEGGLGDLRLGADLRVFGEHRKGITGAIGIQAWLPTGQQSQWASDGELRMGPRVMFSGEIDRFVWAAQVGFMSRERSELTGSAAAGVRIARSLVVGPEIFASTEVENAFDRTATPVEAIFGAHWLFDQTARIGLGAGHGLTSGVGAPAWRLLFGIEWSPAIPSAKRNRRVVPPLHGPGSEPDEDLDGIPDAVDACPHAPGLETGDPKTNGCPPDTDGDGIDDLADACPTVPGIKTDDPETNGCPDRDRDKDGIPNDVDACPDDRGPADIDPRRNGCPQAFVRGSRIEVLDPIAFKPGTTELAPGQENESVLTAVLSVLLKLPEGRKLRIEGHTDNRGDAATNRKLGAARAAAVAKWLTEHGIDAARITSEGVGPDCPIATNETEIGRTQNRRLEFVLDP